MTLTDKQLAEFAAEFLGADKVMRFLQVKASWSGDVHDIFINEKTLFDDVTKAPILMHLAKREMEKQGWKWRNGYNKFYWVKFNKRNYYWDIVATHENDNEFRAFWPALEQAVKGGKHDDSKV